MVIYDGKKLIPAPLVSFVKQEDVREDGAVIGSGYQITVRGKLVAFKGSPDSAGAFWSSPGYPPDEEVPGEGRLRAVLRKQEALAALFANEGRVFEVQSPDGSQPRVCNPRVLRVAFPEGQWYNHCDYEITMEADSVSGMDTVASGPKVSRVGDEWTVEPLDEAKGTYRLTHSVSAVGKRFFLPDGTLEKEAWEQAEDWVLQVAGLGLRPARLEAPGVLDASNLQAFNYIRTNSVNEAGGVFAVTETWLCFDPQGGAPAVHEQSVSVREAANGRVSVTVEGTIQGLEVRDNNTRALSATRFAGALAKWQEVSPTLLAAAESSAGVSLNPSTLAKQVGKNELAGTVSYSYEYDNRPSPTVPGALSQSLVVRRENAADVYAAITIPGRAVGPILQSIGTRTLKKRTVSLRVQMPAKSRQFTPAEPDTDAIMVAQYPSANAFVESDVPEWDEDSGQYTRTVTFAWVT